MLLNIKSITDLSGFYVVYNTTIKNENKGTRGISHFIEHLMCKGFENMLDEFEKNGVNWNAYTSDTKIVFYITGLDEYLKPYKHILIDKLNDFNIKEKDVETEKKIILEEYSDTFNKQSSAHFLNLYRKLFDNYNPIGEHDDIVNIDINKCVDYKNKYYSKPSKIINVSKNNDFIADIEFNNLKNDYNVDFIKDNKYIHQKSNIFKSKTSMIYLSKIIKEDYPLVNFTTSILGNGLKSPLYQETREKNGLVYYINCYLDHMSDKSALINISTETNDTNIDILNDKIYEILSNKEKYITKKRFDTVKMSYDIHYKKTKINRYTNVNKYISPEEWLIEPVLNDITLDKIYDIYDKYFNYDNFYVSYDKTEFS